MTDNGRFDAHRSSQLRAIEQMAQRAQRAQAFEEQAPTERATVANPPRDSSPADGRRLGSSRLSREEWLRRELESERLKNRTTERTQKRVERVQAGLHVFGPRREESLLRARARVRAQTMEARPAALRAFLNQLQLTAATAYLAIGFKRICDGRGWSPVDEAARRRLALLLFFRELAIPHNWNARYVRPRARRGSRRMAKPERLAESGFGVVRKYTPCARAIDQREVLTDVLASDGHSAIDDRSCNVKTVQRALRDLEDVQLVQSVQVPLSAAEPWELGNKKADGTQWAFNRYYVATPGSPKPALMGYYTELDPAGAEVLERPWRGMRPQPPPPDASPPA